MDPITRSGSSVDLHVRAVMRAARAVASSLDLDEVLQTIVDQARAISGAPVAWLYLFDEETRLLRYRIGAGVPDDVLRGLTIPLGQGLSGRVAATGEPLNVPDAQGDARAFFPAFRAAHSLVSYLGLAIKVGARLLGVLVFNGYAPRAYARDEIAYLEIFAQHAAIAIENARLYLEISQHAKDLERRVHERTRELEAANRELVAASHHQSEFLANMSHEIRTPLNSTIGFSELLLNEGVGPLNARQQRFLSNIHRAGQHLLQLINDILDLSKVEAGKLVLQPEPLPTAQVLEDILVIARGLANKKAQTLDVDIPPDLPRLRADPVRFKQICFNLLSNAVKFTPEGGRITVTARKAAGGRGEGRERAAAEPDRLPPPASPLRQYVEISVSDTGAGIRPDDLPKLFGEFVQLETTRAQRHEGTGLGLSLTKRLVELHGGRIHACSGGEGLGSTFRVQLPLRGPEGAEPTAEAEP